jgi:hypothetical protein
LIGVRCFWLSFVTVKWQKQQKWRRGSVKNLEWQSTVTPRDWQLAATAVIS